ncbi:MAG: DUF2126 domain-containing protein [Planctomycetaceae bacterium]
MTIRVALNHTTAYTYDRRINVGPQTIRLRPAVHCRTPIQSYSLEIDPADHFLNWQQDPHGNFLARAVFADPIERLSFSVSLVADMTVINPFGFFVEEAAEEIPFEYAPELKRDLAPWLIVDDNGKEFAKYFETINRKPRRTIDFLVEVNQKLSEDIDYLIRMEPGVQSCKETLTKKSGSCRDSAWLLVQLLRQYGLAARFVSGYLIQLVADQKSLDGPSGPEEDFTDLHAWTEVYLPGAGWIGLDPTSGLLAGEGHIPLACSPQPTAAAPITGTLDECEVEFDFSMSVTRIHEDPRVTKPYTDQQWKRVLKLGDVVDQHLEDNDVRLTMGGEPTFVSIDDQEGEEWNGGAVGEHKQRLSIELVKRLRDRYAGNGLLHFGQGKWYPGESLPRWAHTCMWRTDGEPLWSRMDLLTEPDAPRTDTTNTAADFMIRLSQSLDVKPENVVAAFEDVLTVVEQEQNVPIDEDPSEFDADSSEDRRRLARILTRGVTVPAGFVLPLQRAWWQARAKWASGPWPFRSGRMVLIPGDSPVGLRLPLERLPSEFRSKWIVPRDPTMQHGDLVNYASLRAAAAERVASLRETTIQEQSRQLMDADEDLGWTPTNLVPASPVVTTALCVEVRNGKLCVFLPPVASLEDYVDLVAHVEATAEAMDTPVILEGYLPPHDSRLQMIKVTPDPGVIEVNVHPTSSWRELVSQTEAIYRDARQTRLGTEKFQVDGRHTGTGGGNHIVMGGATPLDSPFLRRPDVLRSFVGYWNDHPALSYVFSGMFIGPTSQAPRVDEGRADAMYELELAFQQIPEAGTTEISPWLVDRVFRNLLVDLTGNTHRAEFCIDKLFSPDSSTGRLGLVELRAFEMPPHERMSLAQQLLVRGLLAMFWKQPYHTNLTRWGTTLHDRFMLPWFLDRDLQKVIADLNQFGFAFEADWFAPHLEFRCPKMGEIQIDDTHLEVRQAMEPWYVLGEEPGGGGTARYVDSSVERLQVLVTNLPPNHAVCVNGVQIPLRESEQSGTHVAGVRYRAWQPPSCLQPTIPVNTPLTFDIVNLAQNRSIAGCQYHIDEPGGINSPGFPVNALEAESRRAARFKAIGHTPGVLEPKIIRQSDAFPFTLDLRWVHV